MKKHQRWVLGLAVLLLATLAAPGRPQENQKPMSLSLQECIVRAMQHNLGVAIDVLGPQLAYESVSRAQEKFLPSFSFSFSRQSSNTPSYSFLEAAANVIDKTNNFTFLQGTESVPFGGTLSLALTGYVTDTNRSFQTINPRYSSTFRLNFSQPLLRNFGYAVSRRDIVVARYSLDISENTLKRSLMDTVYEVESGYWSLVYSVENLKVRQQTLDLAKDLLDMNQRMVEVGTLAPMEILAAQAEVATREADLIQAQTQVQSASDQLKVLINLPEAEQESVGTIVPVDTPNVEVRTINLDEALASALQLRPDLEASRLGIKSEEFNVSYSRNQVLPDLNLNASLSSPGISGTQILYQDDNPLTGIVVGTVPGGFSGAFKDTTSFRYPNWSLGLTLSIPTANFFSRASYEQAKINLRQAMLELENQQQQVFLEIRNAVRAVDANFKRIAAYRVARELAEQKLAAEQEKFRVGQSTNYTVLTYQRDLANARISELNSVISYNVSLAALDRSTGLTLKNKDITFSDFIKK
jgi:outer membrane protein TolC